MTLKDQMLTDATAVFLNEDEFAESIVYRPFNGTPRTISALVTRNPPADLNGVPYAQGTFVMIVEVANSETTGIALSELNTGKDFADIAEKYGGTAKQRTIVKLVDQDSAMLALEVR